MTAKAAALSRTSSVGSKLVRVLADWAAATTPGAAAAAAEPKQSFAERLGLWLDWTDAIALSAALNARPAAPAGVVPGGLKGAVTGAMMDATTGSVTAANAAFEACTRVRRELAQLATADVVFTADKSGPTSSSQAADGAAPRAERAADFAPYRRDYLAHQRAMDASIGPLRAQVRAALAGHTPGLSHLAALDAVMDEALRPHERHLLSTVPQLLEMHFEHLQALERQAQAEMQPDTLQPALLRYGKDMQIVLLAELDIRLQPVEGLLEALRHEMTPLP